MSTTATLEEQQEIEQFLYHEAFLLDERCFEDWLGLFCDDVRYWMPTRRTVAKSLVNTRVEVSEELAASDELGWFDESKMTLLARVMCCGVASPGPRIHRRARGA